MSRIPNRSSGIDSYQIRRGNASSIWAKDNANAEGYIILKQEAHLLHRRGKNANFGNADVEIPHPAGGTFADFSRIPQFGTKMRQNKVEGGAILNIDPSQLNTALKQITESRE